MKNYLTEFIGTFFLVLTVGLTVVRGTQFAGLAIGCSLMIMVYMGGHISGGHYNPAVSLAVWLRGKLPTKELAPYWISQLLGAIVASLVVLFVLGKTFTAAPGADVTSTAALLIELLFTFALALVVLNVATSQGTAGNSFYGLAIGFTIVVAAYAGGPISGGAFNPAVGLGPMIVNAMFGGGSLGNMWIYIVGPLLGGALAAAVFRVQEGVAAGA
ncbi:MAG TPA: aquaporin [Gemmatimonadaceae bacterium]|nr:aquaporin [Gemmatimonadaceae bacterium]